ncbi:hypothetical protein [Hellea balneolensis]|nr:hypothetical protein [Hellea balneolensis]
MKATKHIPLYPNGCAPHKVDGPQGDALMDTKVFFKVLQNISPAAVIFL